MHPATIAQFRHALPYINTHRGKTFVIMLSAQTIDSIHFSAIAQDIALLHSLGIRLVVVYGARVQIDEALKRADVQSVFHQEVRITGADELPIIASAVGSVRLKIESQFCGGFANTPLFGSKIITTSGNFVSAKPFGVRDGVDFCQTGEVRRVDKLAISHHLEHHHLIIISPLAFSATGELYNLEAFDVAKCVATALNADKLIVFGKEQGVFDAEGNLLKEMTVKQAKAHPDHNTPALKNAINACISGVLRVHLLGHEDDGALLKELFTTDGAGTMISQDPYDTIRQASVHDVMGILALIKPLEDEGILIKRPKETLEAQIEHFCVIERDGKILGCAGLYPLDEDSAEIMSVAIDPAYRSGERGTNLLKFIENKARQSGKNKLFALTTRTLHWFIKHGFYETDPTSLPDERYQRWHNGRNAKVLVKPL